MVDLGDESIEVGVDVPTPAVNVQVFGDGSISEAFGGFLSSLIGGFTSFTRKIVDSDTSMKALVNLTAVTVVVTTLIVAYRTIGR